jgi:hypothetical protein
MGEGKESNIERLLFDPDNRPVVGLLDFLTLFILYSSLIPISLYVSIEIIKFFQVRHSFAKPAEALMSIAADTVLPLRHSNTSADVVSNTRHACVLYSVCCA